MFFPKALALVVFAGLITSRVKGEFSQMAE
jgi:hypothetical protein